MHEWATTRIICCAHTHPNQMSDMAWTAAAMENPWRKGAHRRAGAQRSSPLNASIWCRWREQPSLPKPRLMGMQVSRSHAQKHQHSSPHPSRTLTTPSAVYMNADISSARQGRQRNGQSKRWLETAQARGGAARDVVCAHGFMHGLVVLYFAPSKRQRGLDATMRGGGAMMTAGAKASKRQREQQQQQH
ncbi:hypothetical protein GQ54DRAFT_41914 [Martensiomyces pterosporus]|nr:hypothetical protein GQ54DRAFT_41914 [Martensiomyces pterosporus]